MMSAAPSSLTAYNNRHEQQGQAVVDTPSRPSHMQQQVGYITARAHLHLLRVLQYRRSRITLVTRLRFRYALQISSSLTPQQLLLLRTQNQYSAFTPPTRLVSAPILPQQRTPVDKVVDYLLGTALFPYFHHPCFVIDL